MAAHYFDTVENSVTGKPVANATVTVYLSSATVTGSVAGGNLAVSGTLATIYSDDGVTSINQTTSPLTTDSTGYFEFWTSESSVVMLISYDGAGRRAITDVDLIGSSVSSDVAALGTRMTAAEVITLDATVVAFKGLTGAADKVPYFTGVDTMALADFTAAGRALVDDANASAQLTTLGVSTYIKTLLDDADAATARATLGVGIGEWQLQWGPLDNEPPAANYATLDTRNGRPVLDFDTTTQEAAIFSGTLPPDYGGAGITVSIFCALTSATTGTVGWDVAIERIDASSLDIDSDSFAAAQTVTAVTVPGTSGQVLKMSVNIANGADMDSLAAGELFRLRVRRDVANDTATGDAELLRVLMVEQ